ncbi:hypothetical protein PULV_a1060 [Pseudoalteromonas ulvae UL12]|uniref:NAD(P)H-dependent oxidoreductase n=1 Tax=Pseudoalteromonas ulvae TaxID=107327 RepID=UPI00186BA7AB|nr:NAD(P)H-dependent oxidoreductase [Pseudoalteromonas ulvae]MBE0363595.1 hypothetical protein [Pseudoalteromonas ulvae UL12]
MHLLIVNHPSRQSLTYSIYSSVIHRLSKKGVAFKCLYLDEYDMNFYLTKGEWDSVVYSIVSEEQKNKEIDKLIEEVREAETISFFFPIWWYGMPALLKGWFDKILIQAVAGEAISASLKSKENKLKFLKKINVITSCDGNEESMKELFTSKGILALFYRLEDFSINPIHVRHYNLYNVYRDVNDEVEAIVSSLVKGFNNG